MKKYFIHIILIILAFLPGCDKPGPTELVEDEAIQVEILGKDLDNEYYSNGYDTSGVIENSYEYSSVISLSSMKLTVNGTTLKLSSAQAYLFDLSQPVYSPSHVLIGYKTIDPLPGVVRFNSIRAREREFRVKYRESGVLIDTVLGKRFELFNRQGKIWGDPFDIAFDSQVNFLYNPLIGQTISFDIPTPKEITASVKFIKRGDTEESGLQLNWNGEQTEKFFIIIGGIRSSNEQAFPFFRIKTADDGSVFIPGELLKNIPKNKFNKFSITFLRRYQSVKQIRNSDLLINSQSIHTLLIDIP